MMFKNILSTILLGLALSICLFFGVGQFPPSFAGWQAAGEAIAYK